VRRSRALRVALVSCILLWALASPFPAAEKSAAEPVPLTNEDIVRMVMSGIEESTILERIRSSPCAFDVARDILSELRVARVSQPVIDAMIARSRVQAPPAAPLPEPAGSTAAAGPGWIEIVFDVDPNRAPAISSVVAPALVKWQDEGRPEVELPARLAFVLTCTEPTHVPAHWQKKTRLSPEQVGRHKLLLLEESTATVEGAAQFIYLRLPASWRVEETPGTHKGMVGAAVKVGDREEYIALHLEPYKDLVVAPGEVTIMKLRIRSPDEARRSRRSFLQRSPKGLTSEAGWVGDPRLRPTIKIVEITPPPSAAKAPEQTVAPDKPPE